MRKKRECEKINGQRRKIKRRQKKCKEAEKADDAEVKEEQDF